MVWRDLLQTAQERVLPWLGGRKISDRERTWKILGALPDEYGWYKFDVSGNRNTKVIEAADLDPEFENRHPNHRGYLVGNRLIADNARVELDPKRLIEQTRPVFLVEPGLEQFSRVVVCRTRHGNLVYMRQEFPQGPEFEVMEAYQDRLDSVDHIAGVTPPLELAFRWVSYQRQLAEHRAQERERRRLQMEAKRVHEQKVRKAIRDMTNGQNLRDLAQQDFNLAAQMALRITGAEFLDARDSTRRGEKVVKYRFKHQRLECVVDAKTLQVIDAGVCLEDHQTGERGDTYFTLESLPAVIDQAMEENRLVVWRHG